jgi:hypothetical protein
MRGLFDRLRGKKEEPKRPVLPVEEIIFNVDNFNIWFKHPENNAVYANEGIFLRTDKLSESHIKDYLLKSYGLINGGFLFSKPYNEMISDLFRAVQKDWIAKNIRKGINKACTRNEDNTDRQ